MSVVTDDLLRRDIRLLDDKLDAVIVEQAGPEASQLVADIRRLARERRLGKHEAESLLATRIAGLSIGQARIVTRSLSIFFDLANIAEDQQRVRVLRQRERDLHPKPLGESLAAAIQELAADGMSAPAMQQALNTIAIELVFTAHPSEAKRRSIRAKLRRMRKNLHQLHSDNLLPREREELEGDLHTELMILWETEFLKPSRPTVLDEVDRGLSIMPRLWEAVPKVYESMRRGLESAYPGTPFEIPVFLTFGSWMGGDRDGNPFVTTEITESTLLRLRAATIKAHLTWCQRLYEMLTISLHEAHGSEPLQQQLLSAAQEWPALASALEQIPPHEAYRRWLRMIEFRLQASDMQHLDDAQKPGSYQSSDALLHDVSTLVDCLDHDHGLSADSPVRRWLDLVRTFGLHMTRLDVRQDARAYEDIMADIFEAAGIEPADTFRARDNNARADILNSTMGTVGRLPEENLKKLSRDTVRLFSLLQRAAACFGPECLGGAIVSLTRSPADVLCVLWLWRWAQRQARENGESVTDNDIAIMPLFEKIHDLRHGHETLGAILDTPAYREHLRNRGDRQIVMVGYSDSTKDGGYLAACWGLQSAQSRLHAAASSRGIALTFFHGRGGSLGRGGGPAARGILSLPVETLDGSLRLTEQGEVLAERYDDPQIACRHLEQVTWATLMATCKNRPQPKQEWITLIEKMASQSHRAYRELIDETGFIDYFSQTTPIDDIETLPIASRPSRRRGERTLDDLRAIPWVFAWTQSRCMIPAWYGLGAALTEVKYDNRQSWQTICEMYTQWPFFQATIDNASLAIAKADMYIAQQYAELIDDADLRRRIWQRIAAERDRTRQAILDIVGATELLANTPWFQRSIEARNPTIDPLNLIQIEFMRRRATSPPDERDAESLHDLLRLCVQGIASGMRTTG